MLYSFDDYTLDAEHYELRQAGRLVRLAPRVFDLLAHLVKHPGRVVTNEELKEQLWPGSVVGEASLANAVAQARKALGDTGLAQRYIQTVHRRGYRFVAMVTVRPAAKWPQMKIFDRAPSPRPLDHRSHMVAGLTGDHAATANRRRVEAIHALHRAHIKQYRTLDRERRL